MSHHARIGDHCFIAAGAVVGGNADLGPRCFLGLNSTVRDGVTVPSACLIGAGAAVISDPPAAGTYMGVPARLQTPRSELK